MFTHKEVPAASSAAQQWEVQHQDGQAAQDCKPTAETHSPSAVGWVVGENSTVHFDSWTSIYHNNCLIQNDINFTQDQQSMHKSSSVVQAWPGTTGPQANIVTHIDHDFVLAHTPGVSNGVCQS